MKWRTIGLIAGALAAVWFIAGFVLAGREGIPPAPGMQPLTLHGGRVVGNRISTRSWTFDYQRAQWSSDGAFASVDGVRNGILYKKGKPYLGLSAQHVSINAQTFDFTATGEVRVRELAPKDGIPRSFATDLVQWTNATKMLTLSHPSLFRTGDQILKVASITVDFNANAVHTGKIEGTVEQAGP
jgi:hypothetical protein